MIQFFGVAIWAWIVLIISLVMNILSFGAMRSVRRRAERLGMPVSGKDKLGVITLLWGKNVWMKYSPTVDSNTVEIELDKKKGIKGVWSVEDLVTRPVKGLYGMSAALLTYDTAHALDPRVDNELALIENAEAPDEVKKHLMGLIQKLYQLVRDESIYESTLKQLEKGNMEGTSEYREITEKLLKVRKEREKVEAELTKYPIVSKLKKGEAFVFTGEDGTAYIVRQVNIDRLKRFARALNPVTLWASIKSYYETLKGDKGDFYKMVMSIAVLLVVAGIVIAIILAARGNGINAQELAKALHSAAQPATHNVTKVVVG